MTRRACFAGVWLEALIFRFFGSPEQPMLTSAAQLYLSILSAPLVHFSGPEGRACSYLLRKYTILECSLFLYDKLRTIIHLHLEYIYDHRINTQPNIWLPLCAHPTSDKNKVLALSRKNN